MVLSAETKNALVERGGRLVRDGGKPHFVDELYRVADRDETFVRGRVRHVDHQTIVLDFWHRVVRNKKVVPDEVDERQVEWQRIAWLD